MSRRTVETLDDDQWYRFLTVVYEPWINLAERVGYFRGEFAALRHEVGGFDPEVRYILDRDMSGDSDAAVLKRAMVEAMKRMWGIDYDPSVPSMDREWQRFFGSRPFRYPARSLGGASLVRGDDFDTRISFFLFPLLSQYGFEPRKQKSTPKEWMCWTTVGGRRVEIRFQKEPVPNYRASGSLAVPDFGRAWPLAYPFFFSGGPHFHYSKSDNLTSQVNKFFGAYSQIVSIVWKTVTESIDAGNEFLRKA